MTAPRQWISALGDDLAVQRSLLHRLVDAVEADQRWEWLELSCSVAAGSGDALSDLDVGLGYAGTEAPAVAEVTAMLQGLGPVVDLSAQPYEGRPRWWVQYTNGGQLDLVVIARRTGPAGLRAALLCWTAPAGWRRRSPRRSGRPAQRTRRTGCSMAGRHGATSPSTCSGDRSWRRSSSCTAPAGGSTSCGAVGEAVPYPPFGIVSLLDDQPPCLPPGIEDTYAVASSGSVQTAPSQRALCSPRQAAMPSRGWTQPCAYTSVPVCKRR